ncbi:MAG: riboflavin biosynthesis protein RibF [Clostridia bacterium]|nr:riboflavin biosynthesis protein RibF [Clostridia bacterium]
MIDAIRTYDLKKGRFCECPPCDLVLALGNFDGIHLAHGTLFAHATHKADERTRTVAPTASAAFCFEPPSSCYFGLTDGCLSALEEKLSQFKSNALDYALLADFSKLRDLSPEAFVRDVLIRDCHAVHVVCGFNYHFGKGGRGTEYELRQMLGEGAVDVVAPQYADVDGVQVVISSTAIRAALARGDMSTAAQLLGRPYSLTAPVVHGKQLGRTLGLPTVNQNAPEGKLLPSAGIYASRVRIGEKTYLGVSNVGRRPTVDGADAPINCETHILDFDRDLYGETITVEFLHRLRDERRFESVEALRSAVLGDIAAAKNYFHQ